MDTRQTLSVPAQTPMHDHEWHLVTEPHVEIGLAEGRYKCTLCQAVWQL